MSGKAAHSPRFEVTVGGKSFTESGGGVTDLVVETTLAGADRFSLTLNVPYDREQRQFSGFSWDDFDTGKSVDVSLGWGDGSLEDLFVGKIHRVTTNFSAGQGPSVGVSGYGLLHDMMRGKKDRSWSETAVKDVVTEVLSSYFGSVTVEGAGMKRDKIYQHDQSDYRFVADLADRYGFRFYSKRNEVFFKPRSSMGSSDPVATLRYGAALESFSGEIDEASAVQKVEVRHWDMQAEKEIVGTASTDAKNKSKEVFRVPCASSDEATTIAETKLDRLSGTRATAHGETDRGVPTLTAGETVTVDDVGSRFSKNYYVSKTTHRVGGSGYRTSFEATEAPE
ncbi:MAG: contractile injection system protein, VgrG/Pvc8 family [Haloarculaceae archaeon]